MEHQNIENDKNIIYNTNDGIMSISLTLCKGNVWKSQLRMAELFATSKQLISYHASNIQKDKELNSKSVAKDYLTTVSDGKKYKDISYKSKKAKSIYDLPLFDFLSPNGL
jgi:hypothetical protein